MLEWLHRVSLAWSLVTVAGAVVGSQGVNLLACGSLGQILLNQRGRGAGHVEPGDLRLTC